MYFTFDVFTNIDNSRYVFYLVMHIVVLYWISKTKNTKIGEQLYREYLTYRTFSCMSFNNMILFVSF